MLYQNLKALHMVAVIGWMASRLYRPRPLVDHADAKKGARQNETFHNGVAWLLADVLPTSAAKRPDSLA